MSNKSDIRVVNFSNYNRPPVVENKTRNWVLNGRNNEYYQYIIDRNGGSTTNSSINNSYKTLTYGKGIAIHDEEFDSQGVKDFNEKISKNDQKAVITDGQLFGEIALQINRQSGNKKKLATINHLAKNKVVPSIKDEDGIIRSYWYSEDWSKIYTKGNEPVEYPAFGFGDDSDLPEIYVGKPYQPGKEYFTDPDYQAGLVYADLEEEISNFYINHVKSGLSFGSVINVPNSYDWDDEKKRDYERKIKEKLTGSSNAARVVVAFNDMNSEPIKVDNIENNTAHKQWDFLVNEARQQLLTAHRATSPMLVGVSTSNGMSSTADEMDTMEAQLMKRVIQPKQDFILDAYKEIFEYFGEDTGDIYYRPLTEIEGETKEEVEEAKEVKSDTVELAEHDHLEEFIALGEVVNRLEFDLIDEIEIDYDEENQLFGHLQLATTGTARPNSKSVQDGEDFIVRYKYVGNPVGEREFCNKMIRADKVYRKEDIIQMGSKPVNKGFGMDGADTYSIWLYKGGGLLSTAFPGGTCKHKWNRVIYLKKGKNVDVNSPLAKTISTSEARRRGLKVQTNDSKVSVAPHDVK